jgi:uncharacterized protein with GYD domain
MSTYVTLIRLSPQALATIKDPKKSYDDMVQAGAQMGVKVLGGYAVLGPYDLMLLYEAPDEIKAAGMATTLGAKMGGQAETWTLIPPEAFNKLFVVR